MCQHCMQVTESPLRPHPHLEYRPCHNQGAQWRPALPERLPWERLYKLQVPARNLARLIQGQDRPLLSQDRPYRNPGNFRVASQCSHVHNRKSITRSTF